MNKFFDFIERLAKTFILTSAFTLMFLLVTFSIFYLFGVELNNDAIYYFTSVVFVCMAIISYEFLKEVEFDK
jgi:uncharacterized membrane protein